MGLVFCEYFIILESGLTCFSKIPVINKEMYALNKLNIHPKKKVWYKSLKIYYIQKEQKC